MPEISVVMSVYNEPADWIRQSIDSILNQTFTDFEFIIVNDNPGGVEQKSVLDDYAVRDNRIKIIENQENLGLTKSLNIGIAATTGKYIARMDADDISMPNRFQVQYDYMEQHHEVDVCGTWARLFGDISILSNRKNKTPVDMDEIKVFSLFYNPIIHPSALIRKGLKEVVYDEQYEKAQDYYLWGDMIIAGRKLANIPKYLLRYRVTRKSKSAEYSEKQYKTANLIRERLLNYNGINISERDCVIHNNLCSLKDDNADAIEQWLLKLLQKISYRKPQKAVKYIHNIFEQAWANYCIMTRKKYSFYLRSKLHKQLNFGFFFRFLKKRTVF